MRLKNATLGERAAGERSDGPAHASRERAIAVIAGTQHGLVTTRQLLTLGFSPRAIARRVQAGRLHRVRRGVYAVGHCVLTPAARRLSAVLACGDGALGSHAMAAAIWRVRPGHGCIYHVISGGGRSHDDIRVHRVRDLAPDDRAHCDGIPVTSLARTLVDLGDAVPSDHVRAAFIRAEQLRLIDINAIEAVLGRASRRRGPTVLREVLRGYDPRWQATRSPLELRALDAIAGRGLPEPEVNAWIDGRWMVDFLWREERIVLETDGEVTHGTSGARRRDALRERALRRAGFTVLRASFEDLNSRKDEVLAALAAALRADARGPATPADASADDGARR